MTSGVVSVSFWDSIFLQELNFLFFLSVFSILSREGSFGEVCVCEINGMHLAAQEKAARLDYSHLHPAITQTFPLCALIGACAS